MSLVFSMPGKIGDAILQWPVAYHYCREHETRCTLWLDENSLKPLVPLFEAQPCVEKVELKSGVTSYHMGGQPFDFGLKTEDYVSDEVHHLGFRKFPQRQITLETLTNVSLNIDADRIAHDPSLFLGPVKEHDRVVLHGAFASHQSGVPGFWRFLYDIHDELPSMVFVGTAQERRRALELYSEAEEFDDAGNFLELARFIQGSKFVVASGSCVAALASVLHVPCIRVHDPIGEFPKVIWSGLGDNQLNETELSLRKLWPEWRDRWVMAASS